MNETYFDMLFIGCSKAEDNSYLSISLNSIAMIEAVFDENQNENCLITLTSGNKIQVADGYYEIEKQINEALNNLAQRAHSFCSYHFGITE